MRLLDLFCGAGGAAFGYYLAGFQIVGVDLAPMPRYPFKFEQADALEFLQGVKPGEYDLIHSSPPCQAYSRMRHLPWLSGKKWPDLIQPTREMLKASGIPYVIENVEGAPLIDPVTLCGSMFGLKVYRHRLFECSEWLLRIPHASHTETIGSGRMLNDRSKPSSSGMVSVIKGDVGAARTALGVPWMSRDEVSQAIPPAYTHWIGTQMLEKL